MADPHLVATPENRILAALPADEYDRLSPHLVPVELRLGQVLQHPREPLTRVYFPGPSVVSLVSPTQDGSEVETGLVGPEGLVGVSLALGVTAPARKANVQVPGRALRLPAATFAEALGRGGALEHPVLRYAHALMVQAAQVATCIRAHALEPRLARWLLMCQDRAHRPQLELTQEFVGVMLGVRRSGVTVAMGALEAEGLIEHRRRLVTVRDRAGLEARACECYQTIRERVSGSLCKWRSSTW
jgi:CRP-like cAMP-binding protein